MNKHPHEEVILAYYRGEQIQIEVAGQWEDISPYDETGDSVADVPNFSAHRHYRIKPAVFTVELTKDELEVLWLLTGAVGGHTGETSRRYSDSARNVISRHIPPERQKQLVGWAMKNVRGLLSFLELHK